jgi:ADP-ribosylglycohydrolase
VSERKSVEHAARTIAGMACVLEDQARELRSIAACVSESGDITHALRAIKIAAEIAGAMDVEALASDAFESLGVVVPRRTHRSPKPGCH